MTESSVTYHRRERVLPPLPHVVTPPFPLLTCTQLSSQQSRGGVNERAEIQGNYDALPSTIHDRESLPTGKLKVILQRVDELVTKTTKYL